MNEYIWFAFGCGIYGHNKENSPSNAGNVMKEPMCLTEPGKNGAYE